MQFSRKDYRELAEKIESGEYFQEAQNWYLRKYIYNSIERVYLLAIMGGFAFLAVLLLVYYQALLPIKKSLPVQVNIPSVAEFSTRITYLGNAQKNFDINNVYIKYFSERFVEALESYDHRNEFKKLRINKNIIKTLASEDINAYFLDRISIRNRDSIILKYRRDISRYIFVDKGRTEIAPVEENKSEYSYNEKKNEDIKNYQATVNFTAVEVNKNGSQERSNWQAKIVLSFQTIKYNHKEKDFSPLNFKVLSYEAKKID